MHIKRGRLFARALMEEGAWGRACHEVLYRNRHVKEYDEIVSRANAILHPTHSAAAPLEAR